MTRGLLLIVCALMAPAAFVHSAADDTPTALAASIQRHYDQVRDFQADFTHSYVGGILRKKTVERGHMAVRKPGRMRWTYTQPEEKVFVSDGNRLYSYVPADKQVYVAAVPTGDQATTPVLFLAGKGNIQRDFSVAAVTVPEAPAGSVALKLTPHRPEREYDWLDLVVDKSSLELRMLVTSDSQGGLSTFTFSNLRENSGISDKAFVFVIPRGVDVITDAGR
jgi:outer membrane lipoprotein carrier protein